MGYKLKKIYVGSQQARPASGWQPGANTVAYYPLTSTTQGNDMKGSGTAYDLSVASGTVSYTTVGGVDSANFDSGYLSGTVSTIPQGANIRTISVWVYHTANVTEFKTIWGYGAFAQKHKQNVLVYTVISGYTIPYLANHYDDLADFSPNASDSLNTWYNYIYVYDGTNQILYKNGNLYLQQDISGWNPAMNTDGTTLCVGGGANYAKLPGNISNLIVENKAWSSAEVSDYFDSTKADYISS